MRATMPALRLAVFRCRFGRHISLGYIAGKRGRIAGAGIAVAAAARALHHETLAGRHLVAARWRLLRFAAKPDHEARAATGLAARETAGRKAALVVAADHGRTFQQLVFA